MGVQTYAKRIVDEESYQQGCSHKMKANLMVVKAVRNEEIVDTII